MKPPRLLLCLWIALAINVVALLAYYAKEVWL